AAWKMIQDRIDSYKTGKKVFSIHNATAADADDYAFVICESWKAAYAEIISPEELAEKTDVQKRTAFLKTILADPNGYFYLAYDGGKPCGACSACKSRDGDLPDWGEIVALYTLKEYWGHGVGKLLMDTVLAELKRMGYRNVLLWAFEKNARARRFYEKYGFAFDGTYKDSGLKDRKKTQEVRYRIDLFE
ncbi:MAG TPA: GNAT family N-acetyltransferase, partial [Clostridiales bacterium]|nr:GNAT family N-acetyltransferase [Clostridiales bacterium]